VSEPASLTDPTPLYRLRDGLYAADLLIVVVTDLNLFTWLDARRRAGQVTDLNDLMAAHGIDARAADVMVTYLVARGLLCRETNGALVPTPLAIDHLVAGSPYDLRSYFGSMRERPTCTALAEVLRTGRPMAWASALAGQQWSDRLDSPEFAAGITAAMDARAAYLGPALAAAIADIPADRALDIGGGSGSYAMALAASRPSLTVDVLERPPVDQVARTLLAARGHANQIGVITGDMFDILPSGYDLHLYSHVLHDWGADQVRELVARSAAALPPGGWLVIHDTHIDEDRSGPLPIAEYSVLLMASTLGKCWSLGELREFLATAGFTIEACRSTGADRTVLVARRA